MLRNFKDHINNQFPEISNSTLLLAISGGIDSMVLANLCLELKLNFVIAHCNFQLRGDESNKDENLVKDFCIQNSINYHIVRFETELIAANNKKSIQVIARELRYEWFNDLCNKHHYQYILTAHHLDDQVETFLINFTRGTGIDGLLGIPERNKNILRPLLPFSRDEILNFATNSGINWREDASNATTKYYRNKLRHLVIPILKAENTQFLNGFKKTLNHLKQTQNLANFTLSNFKNEYVTILNNRTIIDLKDRNNTVFIDSLFSYLLDFGFDKSLEIEKILDSQPGKLLKNDRYILLKDRGILVIYNNLENKSEVYLINNVNNLGYLPIKLCFCEYFLNDYNSDKNTIFVDSNQLTFPLKLRKKIDGDVFKPFGFDGFKKVSKFLKDEKVSKFHKDNLWILENGDGKIIWLIGYRMDDRFKVNNNNQKVYKLSIEK